MVARKYKYLTLVTLASILLVGCKSKNKDKEEEYKEDLTPDFVVDAELCDTMETIEDKSCYNIRLNYTDKYFKYTASTFKKDLMLLSFGATNSAVDKTKAQKFFGDIGFTTLYTAPEYDTGGTETSAQYIIAKKVIDDFTVFAVSFKGHDYGQEWSSNLNVGESGNHAGFMATAANVYNNLLTYLTGEHNYKLWISGYSRGGALSNVLSHLVMSNTTLGINETNLYTYTFAGTRGLTEENAKPYKNVFNLFNSADILSNFAPSEFGLYRCGQNIDIFDEHLDEYMPSFSPEMDLGKFTESKGVYKNDKEWTKYFLGQLLKEDTSTYPTDKYPYDLTSRAHYYQVQQPVQYLLSHILGMPGYFSIIPEEFKDITASEIASYLSDNGEKLDEKFEDIFDRHSVQYEHEALLEACRVTSLLLNRYLNLILKCISNSNISRMIGMHYIETIYILIQRVNY